MFAIAVSVSLVVVLVAVARVLFWLCKKRRQGLRARTRMAGYRLETSRRWGGCGTNEKVVTP